MRREQRRGRKNVDNLILRWGILYGVSVLIMSALMGYYLIASRTSIRERVQKQLQEELDNDVAALLSSLQIMTTNGQTVANILAEEESPSEIRWGNAAETLCQTTDAYAAAIIDTEGKGISSFRKEISLGELEYFRQLKVQAYFYIEDDHITGSPAIVSMIPIKTGDELKGMVYLYYDPDELKAKVNLKAGKQDEVFCLIDNDGKYMAFIGEDNHFSPEGNFHEELCETIGLDRELTPENLSKKIKNSLSRFYQSVDAGGTEKVIVGKSLKVRSWYLLHIMDQSYIDAVVRTEWKAIQTMVFEIMLVVIAFYIVIILLEVMSYKENKETRMALKDEAETDLLTGLNNKIATEKKIQQYIEENPDKTGMFIIFDIDNFKKINDTKGHAFGDEVLQTLGRRILGEFRYSDILGRTGGDEFIIFLKGIKEGQQLETQKERLNNFFKDFSVGSYVKYSPTASIGVSLYPKHGKSYQELYECGDKALYEAKRNGKNQLMVYEEHMMGPNPAEFKGRTE